MNNVCKIKNYSKDRSNSILFLNSEISKIKSFDDKARQLVDEKLKSSGLEDFATNFENSLDPEYYDESISLLAKDVALKFKKAIGTQSNKFYLDVIDYIESKYSRPLSTTERYIKEVFPGTDVITINALESLKYSEEAKFLYGSVDDPVNATRENIFNNNMKTLLIIDTRGEGKIIDNVTDVNNSIVTYLSELFNIIKDFLIANEYTVPNILMFNTVDGVPDMNVLYLDVLQIMYHYLHNDSKIKDNIEKSWMDSGTSNGDRGALFNATSAYMNVLYFDRTLNNALDGFVDINHNYNLPINIVDDGISITTNYKYTFSSKEKFQGKNNWNDVILDSTKDVGKFLKVLILSIPIRDYRNNKVSTINMEAKDFIGAVTMLFDAAVKLPYDLKNPLFINSIKNHMSNIQEVFPKVLSEIFDGSYDLISSLKKLGLDDNTFNFLYSIYTTLYKGTPESKSWNSVEQNYLLDTVNSDRVPIIETLLGVVNSNVFMLYMLTVYDKDEDNYVTKIKSRVVTNRSRFDIVNTINDSIINLDSSLYILSHYSVKMLENKKDYEITLDDGITFTAYAKKNLNVLHKKDPLSFSNNITKLLNKDFNLFEHSTRMRLASGENLSSDERLLLDLLNFIDSILQTSFATETGLREFALTINANPNNFRRILSTAVRGLVVTDIYNLFLNAKKPKTDSKYLRTELRKFLKDNRNVFGASIEDSRGQDEKMYWTKAIDGNLLTTVRANDQWVEDLAKARAILTGKTAVSVISNLDGDKIPMYSMSYLGAKLQLLLFKSKLQKDSPVLSLMFVNNSSAIKNQCVNTDIKTADNLTKLIRNATFSELLYDSLVNKFIIPYNSNKTIYVQPTVYSDKTKFVLYLISLDDLGLSIHSSEDLIINKFIDTIGNAYKGVWKNVLNDYAKIFPEFKLDFRFLENVLLYLKEHSELDFINKADKNGVIVYRDLHYRKFGKENLSINELLYEFANNLYTPYKLKQRLYKDKVLFIKNIFEAQLEFPIKYYSSNKLDYSDPITNMFLKVTEGWNESDRNLWISGDTLVIARAINKNTKLSREILTGEMNENEEIELNPLLNSYFLLDTLIGNNLRFSLTGSEINHKIKTLQNLNNYEFTLKTNNLIARLTDQRYLQFLKKFSSTYKKSNNSAITYYEVAEAILNAKGRTLDENDQNLLLNIEDFYNNLIYSTENAAQNTLFKRNVIIPGTMRYYLLNTINGIRPEMRVAIIDDIEAKVFNFDGLSKGIDAHDGAAFINAITHYLENWSLLDVPVGTIKKPIHHSYDDKYMTSTLFKYAVDTITNRWMLQAEGNSNGIVLRNLFKKMTNIQWNLNIDLLRCDYIGDYDFSTHILLNDRLFFKDLNKHYEISEFNRENEIYYTEEREVNNLGAVTNLNIPLIKYYHYFDNHGTHYKSTKLKTLELLNSEGLHTINSIYELHTALGGIYSESINDDGFLDYSEISNKITARFVNFVAIDKNPDVATKELNQTNYYQPLKEMMIDMVANNTSIKNGAGNVNPSSSFYDDSVLKTITVSTLHYGILMDADHDADEGQMTEFSLVISSLDTGGKLHEYVSEIYETLGKVAIDLSELEIEAINELAEFGDKTKLYILVGKTIMENIKRNNTAGLANAIFEAVSKEFELNSDLNLAKAFVPFSDPSIYGLIISSFVSTINRKSIKRKYPGLGTVMVPGYDMSMIYDVGGVTYLYSDLLEEALKWKSDYTSDITDISLKHKILVQLFLEFKLNEINPETGEMYYRRYNTPEIFMPTDNISIHFQGARFMLNNLDKNKVEYEIVTEPWADDNTKFKTVLKIYLKGQRHKGSFDLVADMDDSNFNGLYSIHFKTGNPDTGSTLLIIENGQKRYGSTKEERSILFSELYKAIPEGALVSTWGKVSEGGLKGLRRLMGQDKVLEDTRNGINRHIQKEIKIPIYRKLGNTSNLYKVDISLNDINDYYNFKLDPYLYLRKLGYLTTKATFLQNITIPRNLAPSKISWEYTDDAGNIHYMNIFDHWRIKGLFLGLLNIKSNKKLNKKEKEKAEKAEKDLRESLNVLKAFDDLNKGLYYEKNNSVPYLILNLLNKAAELITSNLFKTTFNIKGQDSLVKILRTGPEYFRSEFVKILSDNYNVLFRSRSGNNLCISLNPIATKTSTLDYRFYDWENITLKKYESLENTELNHVIDRIYYTKDNVPMFEIGRRLFRTDLEYRDGKFIDKDTKKEVQHQNRYLRYKNNQVVEKVIFLNRYLVTEKSNSTLNYELFTINREAIKRVFPKNINIRENINKQYENEINNYIGHIFSDIYLYKDFSEVMLNNSVKVGNKNMLATALRLFGKLIRHDQDFSKYLYELSNIVYSDNNRIEDGNIILNNRKTKTAFNEYQDILIRNRYTSFLKSLYFTASRIPALTLLSFMLMKNVGYTGVNNNLCFVSHWLNLPSI